MRIGCRSGAACSLRVDDICDQSQTNQTVVMRAVGRVEEKGGVWREFVLNRRKAGGAYAYHLAHTSLLRLRSHSE